jgi:uncharacterized protein (TIGR00255 family)
MPKSMTGYGSGEVTTGDDRVLVEVSSLNSRFLEMQLRLPKTLATLENDLRELVRQDISRGKITLGVVWDRPEDIYPSLVLNEPVADTYFRLFTSLKKRYNLPGEIEPSHFVGLPDIMKPSAPEINLKSAWRALKSATLKALGEMDRMRQKEGENLARDLRGRVEVISRIVTEIRGYAKLNVENYRAKLKNRMTELLGEGSASQQRLAQEVAFLAERSDITEEVTRLRSHCQQFRQALRTRAPVGKRLTFLLQEMLKEINTIGSKASHIEISNRVIAVKEELEKMREQVQNIE